MNVHLLKCLFAKPHPIPMARRFTQTDNNDLGLTRPYGPDIIPRTLGKVVGLYGLSIVQRPAKILIAKNLDDLRFIPLQYYSSSNRKALFESRN